MDVGHAAHRARRDRRAMVAVSAADDDAPLGLALQIPIVADEADRRVVRFRSGGTIKDVVEIAGDFSPSASL